MLLQALTGGHRTWVGAPPGSKSLGQVMDEMARMEAGLTMDDPLQQLELREHSLALRAQKFGIWSDPVRICCSTAPSPLGDSHGSVAQALLMRPDVVASLSVLPFVAEPYPKCWLCHGAGPVHSCGHVQ